MGLWKLFEVASMPVIQMLIISGLGAFLASGYCNILPTHARRSLNKIVYVVFTPALMFASLAKTVTLQDIIAWWFMPINVGLTFLIGGCLGWIAVKLLKPGLHLEGLVIASCSAANLGNLVLIILPAVCQEDGSPFGVDHAVCTSLGLSYGSFSMALGGFYIWTYTFHLVKSSADKYKALHAAEVESIKEPNKDLEAHEETNLQGENQEYDKYKALHAVEVESIKEPNKDLEAHEETNLQGDIQEYDGTIHPVLVKEEKESFWKKTFEILYQFLEELLAPPTVAAVLGLIFGAVAWLRHLIIGPTAPLHVIQDSVKLVGNAMIPSITLILGGNLTQGIRASKVKTSVIVGILCVKYMLLPGFGIAIVKLAGHLGFLPEDPLYRFVLMLQFTLPPAMSIGTMTQLFDVGNEECSVIFLWTYVFAAPALTLWSTVFMWILS